MSGGTPPKPKMPHQKARGAKAKMGGVKNAAQSARNAFSKEGRKDLVRQAGATVSKAAKTVAKKAAKKVAKGVAKKAFQQGFVACVGSVICIVIVLAALLLMLGMAALVVVVLFSGGADVELASTDAGSGYETVEGTESSADLDHLLGWWRLTSEDINHPVSMVERWVSSGSGDAVLRTAAKSPQDPGCEYADSEGIVTAEKAAEAAANNCDQACDYLLGGLPDNPIYRDAEARLVGQAYIPEQDFDTPESLREEIHRYNELTGSDLCQSWWASVVAWNAALHNTVDIGLRDVIAGQGTFPIRAAIVAAATAKEPVNPYDLHALSVLALWDATGFGAAASNDGFTRLYYAPADMDDYASRTARNASLEHSAVAYVEPTEGLVHVFPAPPGSTHSDEWLAFKSGPPLSNDVSGGSSIRARRGLPYCGHIPELGEPETAAKVVVPVPCPPPPSLEVCPNYLRYTPENARYARNDGRLAEVVVGTRRVVDPAPDPNLDGLPTYIYYYDIAPWGWTRIRSSSVPEGANEPDIVVDYCEQIKETEAHYARHSKGRLVWWAGWSYPGAQPPYHGCEPEMYSAKGPLVMTFCASEVISEHFGPPTGGYTETTVNHGVIKLDTWGWEPPAPPPPDFGKLLSAVVSWQSNLADGIPTAQRAFALAELIGWRPRFGLSPAQASALSSLRSNGQQDVRGCLRLFVAISDAESCKGPTIQQMRLWGWGPDLRDPTRAAALSAVTGRDPLVAEKCSRELADPQSVVRSPQVSEIERAQNCVYARVEAYWGEFSEAKVGDVALTGELYLDCADPPSGGLSHDNADRVVVQTTQFQIATKGLREVTLAPCLMQRAADMFDLAHSHGVALIPSSTYRTYQHQLDKRIAVCGEADPLSTACQPVVPLAIPGHSRHNFGMAIDFGDAGTGGACGTPRTTTEDPADAQRLSICHRWLKLYAPRFGFFPFLEEPWHWSVDGR